MPLVVIVPAALLPAGTRPDPYAALSLPGLARLSADALGSVLADGVPEAWCTLLGAQRSNDWPLAPMAAHGEGLRADASMRAQGSAYWLFATPVQTTVGHLEISVASPRLAIPAAQADRVLRDLGAFFAADELVFARGPSSGEWFVCLHGPVRLDTRPPGTFPGGPLEAFLPGGADAPIWRRWLSEIQMLLHEHPVNVEREAAGEPRIDALWIWGGGSEVDGESSIAAESDKVAAFRGQSSRTDPGDPGAPCASVLRARAVRGYLDDLRMSAVLRGAGATIAGSEADGRALLASAATSIARDPEAVTVIGVDQLLRSLPAGDFAAWGRAVEELDREVFVPLARQASRGGNVRLVLGADRHAVALDSRPASLWSRLARLGEHTSALPSLIETWRAAP